VAKKEASNLRVGDFIITMRKAVKQSISKLTLEDMIYTLIIVFPIHTETYILLTIKQSVMYMCIRGIDFVSVFTIYLLYFGTMWYFFSIVICFVEIK